jgi:Outer membrane lipoprotein carrier protein LolA-like
VRLSGPGRRAATLRARLGRLGRLAQPVLLASVLLIATALAGPAARAASAAIDALLAKLARPAPASTPFIEAHVSPLLTRPLIVTGTLEYLGPDALARTVLAPYHERTEVRGDDVSVQRAGESPRHFSLQRVPEMRSLLASFAALLSGDHAGLERQFTLDLHGDAHDWTLGLTPSDARVREHVRSILVSGRGDAPRCLTTFEANNSTTVTLLGDAARQAVPAGADQAWIDAQCRGRAR